MFGGGVLANGIATPFIPFDNLLRAKASRAEADS